MIIKKSVIEIIKFLSFLVLIYVPIFHHLDWQPINDWDESLFAMRAVYMAEEGEYFYNFNLWTDGAPDQMSSKPPFTTWIQVISLKIFGYSEFALRLPIALCAFFTILLISYISKKEFENIHIGFLSGIVLATTSGYVTLHGSRTGDHDVALSFYMLLGLYSLFKFISKNDRKNNIKWLIIFSLSMAASVLTKYIYGLLFTPGIIIYLLYKRKLLRILKRPEIWLSGLFIFLLLTVWLLVIESKVPGFIHRAFFHEIYDRYTTAYLFHDKPFDFYFDDILNNSFKSWICFYFVTIFLSFFTHKKWKDFFIMTFFVSLVFLLIISCSQTKAIHYTVTIFPLLAIGAGIGLYEILNSVILLLKRFKIYLLPIFVTISLLTLILYKPYSNIIKSTYTPKLTWKRTNYGYLFRIIEKHEPQIKNFILLQPGFDSQSIYYAGLFERTKGYNINIYSHIDEIEKTDTIMVCDNKLIEDVKKKYDLEIIEQYENCLLALTREKE